MNNSNKMLAKLYHITEVFRVEYGLLITHYSHFQGFTRFYKNLAKSLVNPFKNGNRTYMTTLFELKASRNISQGASISNNANGFLTTQAQTVISRKIFSRNFGQSHT